MKKPGLAGRLVLSLTTLVVVVGTVAGTISIRSQERYLLSTVMIGADQLSNGIVSATWHAMLADHRQDAYDIMRTIALKQGIDRIRIFNREGRVMFSTRADETTRRVTKSAQECSVCHSSTEPRMVLDTLSTMRVHRGDDGRRRLTMVTPIYNEPACSNAACHAHPASMKVLGVLDIVHNLDHLDEELSSAKLRLFLLFFLQILLINIFILLFTRRFVARPIRDLIGATKSVSEMNLDETIPGTEVEDELGQLARSFDGMRLRLKSALSDLNQLAQNLEIKVQERTAQLKAAQLKLMQSDRLASLGQLSASVAHEINNPLSGVLNLSMLLQRILRDDGIPEGRVAEFRKYLGQISAETARAGRIVTDLLAFSRQNKPQRSMADLNKVVRSTVSLIGHKLRMSNVEIELGLAESLPTVECDASQMQQVALNLLMNAAEATQGKNGALVRVRTWTSEEGVNLAVSDNGEGIPEQNLPKIFDPFFTTKPEGKGVGLGLAVSYGIVQAHQGEVTVSSRVGEGTTFTVTLPVSGGVVNRV